MTRYHVDTPAKLALVQVALDQAFGLRNAAGNPTPRPMYCPLRGAWANEMGSPAYDLPGTNWPLIQGDDGTAALEIRQAIDNRIDLKLGTTVNGVAIPSAASLVQVTRARDNSLLPAGVRDKLDDAYVDSVYAQNTDTAGVVNTAVANAAIIAELQGRGAAAVARKGVRGQQAQFDALTGLGGKP